MEDYIVSTEVLFQLASNNQQPNPMPLRDIRKAFVEHIKKIYGKDETLKEYINGDLDFTFEKRTVHLEYEFVCHDESEEEAESFSKYCVRCVRAELESFGCRVKRITCNAQEADEFDCRPFVSYASIIEAEGKKAPNKKKTNRKKTCKMNVVNRRGCSEPECTSCGHRFDTDYADNPYREMCRIARGKFSFCAVCGAKYIGCQIEGVEFDKCDANLRDWILRGLSTD